MPFFLSSEAFSKDIGSVLMKIVKDESKKVWSSHEHQENKSYAPDKRNQREES